MFRRTRINRKRLGLVIVIVVFVLLGVAVVGGQASQVQEVLGLATNASDEGTGGRPVEYPAAVVPGEDQNQGEDVPSQQDTSTQENPTTPEAATAPDDDVPYLEDTIHVTTDNQHIVTNPADLLVVANKYRRLPSDYVPENLVVPDVRFTFQEFHPKKQLRQDAATALEKLFAAAEDEGITLYAISGYRSYDTQARIFQSNVERTGSAEAANQFSARPGESEHQTGLSMDVSTQAMGFQLEQPFGETEAGKWLAANAAEYGFIIRYPKGKEDITGYEYEPWHLRYVGTDAADEIMAKGLTLEEYLTRPEDRADLHKAN